jgi:hypothetical protein
LVVAPQVVRLPPLKLLRPGPHDFNIFLRNQLGGRAAFRVVEAAPPSPPPTHGQPLPPQLPNTPDA